MKWGQRFLAIFLLAAGTLAQDQSKPAESGSSSGAPTIQGTPLNFTVFYPTQKIANVDYQGQPYNTSSPLGIMCPEAPPDSELGKRVDKCVGSENDGVVTGLDMVYAGDYKDAQYCVTGWSQHGCIGDYTYVIMKKRETEISAGGGEDHTPQTSQAAALEVFKKYIAGLFAAWRFEVSIEQIESYDFENNVAIKAMTIDKGECPQVKNE